MNSKEIAHNIAWIRCDHRKRGSDPSCVPCNRRFQKSIDDDVDIKAIIAIAKYFEPQTRVDKITPLTWCQAYDIVKIVLKEVKNAIPG